MAQDYVCPREKLDKTYWPKLIIPCNIPPGGTKMYRDLRQHFWWHGMKREIARFVSKCPVCQQVKIEHQRTAGLLQPLPIPE